MVADLLEPGEQLEHQPAAGRPRRRASMRRHRVADHGLVERDLLAGQRRAGGRSRSWPAARGRCRGRTCAGAAGTGRPGRRTAAPWSARGPTRSAPAQTLRKALRLPSSPGVAQSRIAQSSVRLFSTGVPVSATRAARGIGAQRLGGRGAGVLDVLGLVGDHQAPARPSASGRGVAAHRAVGGEHEPGVAGPRRSPRRSERRGRAAVEAAHRRRRGRTARISASQLPSSEAGQTTSVGPASPGLACQPVQVAGRSAVIVLPRPMSSARQAPSPSDGQLGQPGQAVPLVVAQRGRQRRPAPRPAPGWPRSGAARAPSAAWPRRRPRASASSTSTTPVSAAATACGGRDGADQPLARPAGDRGVDDRPVVAELEHRASAAAASCVHLVVGERVAVQRDLPVEGEQRVRRRSSPVDQRLLAAGRPGPVEHGASRSGRGQAARPQHVDARPRRARPRRRRGGSASSSVSRVIWSGTRSSSSRSSTGQASAAAAQRDGGVGAGPVAEAVRRSGRRPGPQQRPRRATCSGLRSSCTWSTSADARRRPAPPRRPRPAATRVTSCGRSSRRGAVRGRPAPGAGG